MEEQTISPHDIILIIQRRKWSIVSPLILIFAVSAAIALLIPSYYKSTATILIENQEIPADFVMATVTSFAEQRLQMINQRIMSGAKLTELINQFNLYPDLRDKWTVEEIIEKLKEDIRLETISTEVIDRRTGRPTTATIAFTLSYMGKSPETVRNVTDTLTSFFLKENLQVRERQTQEATSFLEEEMRKVKLYLDELDEKISAFKKDHSNALPEMLPINIQGLSSADQTISRLTEQLRSFQEREEYLQTQLSGITAERKEDLDQNRIEDLKMNLISLKTRFSDEYPDVVKLKAEIKELEKQQKVLTRKTPDNPAYITIASQLAGIQSEITSIRRQIIDVENTREDYRQRIEKTHGIEGSYNALIIEQNNSKIKYEDLMRKVMEAKMAHGLEKEQKGERFTLIDPARLPEIPFKPNRLAIMLIGLVLGIGAGIGFAALMEFSDDSIRDTNRLSRATSFPVLGVLPEIITQKDQSIKRKRQIAAALGICSTIVVAVVLFHVLYMDLNVFWAKVMRKLSF
jgi:polysaccharide chain length determinant protein (PEP-CTERM system associated)